MRKALSITDGKLRRAKVLGGTRMVTNYQAKRIYERLRKASYRRWLRAQDMNWIHEYWEEPVDVWDGIDHAAYVQGVKDALNEIAK